MARYVDPDCPAPGRAGPGTGPVTEALVEHGIDPARLILVEFNPAFCGFCARAFRRDRASGRRLQAARRLLSRVASSAARGGGLRPAACYQAAARG